ASRPLARPHWRPAAIRHRASEPSATSSARVTSPAAAASSPQNPAAAAFKASSRPAAETMRTGSGIASAIVPSSDLAMAAPPDRPHTLAYGNWQAWPGASCNSSTRYNHWTSSAARHELLEGGNHHQNADAADYGHRNPGKRL